MTDKENAQRKLPCWIASFLEWTSQAPAPEIFRKWAGIATLTSALERRAWVETNQGKLFPNMFILLVGPPGTGKDFAINPARKLMSHTSLKLAPISLTGKGLVDALAEDSACKSMTLNGHMQIYHSLILTVPELGTLIPSHDLGFLSILNELFNCNNRFDERTRGGGELYIEYPHLAMVAGTQSKYLSSLFPEEAYGMGFTSRINMIYSGEPNKVALFSNKQKNNAALEENLISDLQEIASLKGTFIIDPEAANQIEHWHFEESDNDRPTHSRLMHYNSRRIMHILKLSMAKAVSRNDSMTILAEDFAWAKSTLLEAEEVMTEIFKEMATGGQRNEMEEAFHFIMKLYMQTGKKPVPETKLTYFLSSRVPANQIEYIIQTMSKSGMIDVSVDTTKPVHAQLRFFTPKVLTNE